MAKSSPLNEKTSLEIAAFVCLVRSSTAVTRELSRQLSADHGLTLNEYEALLLLARAPDFRMRRVDLTNSLVLTASGVTRLLEGLEKRGFVSREPCAEDRRVTYACLAKGGRDKLREADRTHTKQVRDLMGAHYNARELRQLEDLLDRLVDIERPAETGGNHP